MPFAVVQRREVWRHKNDFHPNHNLGQGPATFIELNDVKKPVEYFNRYLDNSFFDNMAKYTNMKHVIFSGKSLNCNIEEIRKFWGISIIAALLGFPRLRMWLGKEDTFSNNSRQHE
ncbi:hypothetical protein C0J52_03086 [Blattella germanica]|nr:hypothetical protein C0J52_03086 [Blattella germanica]